MALTYLGKTKHGDITFELYEPTDREVEVFVDAIQGMQLKGPNIKINLCRDVPNMEPGGDTADTVKRVVVSRVVMGVDTFFNFVNFLNEHAAKVKQVVHVVPKGTEH